MIHRRTLGVYFTISVPLKKNRFLDVIYQGTGREDPAAV